MYDKTEQGMTLIVKTITRLTLGFILIFGIYITFTGHKSPGGGFAGGVIIALSFIHIMLAFGKEAALKRLRSPSLRVWTCISALIFLCVVMAGFAGKSVPVNLLIPFCEMVIVASGLFAIFIALVFASKADKDAE